MSRPAWVCSPAIFRTPFLRAFLPDYAPRALPGPDVEAVLGWGLKPASVIGLGWSRVVGKPYAALEDGLFRSVGLGESGAAALGLMVDEVGVYYDATRPSRLEQLIASAPDWLGEDERARARGLIDLIRAQRLSKTNLGAPLDRALLRPGRRILLVDQTAGDASLRWGLAGSADFERMVREARVEATGAQLIVKRHPAVAAGLKRGCIPDRALVGLTVIDDARAVDLLDAADEVWTVTSGLGFEALLRGLPVRCFGLPFYAGWGLTRDERACGRRGSPRDVETLVAAALLRHTRWVDPVRGEACSAEAALERLAMFRDRADRLSGRWIGVGFTPPKRGAVRRLMNAPTAELAFHDSPAVALASTGPDERLLVWAGRETGAVADHVARFSGPVSRMEDGFIRSRGLGSAFNGALSAALDDLGVYYDPSAPSRLERLIEDGEMEPELLARARRLRERIVGLGMSKYNLAGAAPPDWPADRERILVPGQVEDDRSILLGCGAVRTNAALVAAVRAERPHAFLIYRDHPDVRTGARPGALPPDEAAEVDARADDLDITACLDACDTVATLTSLTGFEALLRGRRVICHGRPFYAGWGLTQDRLPLPGRTRRAGLDELVAAALILYPLYVTPEGWPCEVEDLVERLAAAAPAPARPRWLAAFVASMDRRRPPAY